MDKQSTANLVKVSQSLKDEIAKLQRDYPELEIDMLSDTSDYIEMSLSNITETALLAAVIAFFVLLLFASLTSSVSILEIFVPNVMELSKGKINRKKSAVLGSALCMLLGIPVSFSFGIWGDVRIFGQDIFSLYDNFICKIAYPLIALCTAVLIAWIWGKKNAVNAITNGGTLDDRFSKVWFNTVKFVCPIFLMIVVLSGFGIIR